MGLRRTGRHTIVNRIEHPKANRQHLKTQRQMVVHTEHRILCTLYGVCGQYRYHFDKYTKSSDFRMKLVGRYVRSNCCLETRTKN